MANSKKIEWEAFEHSHKEQTADWFWAVGIIAIAIAVLAIYFHNFLFALLIVIAGFIAMISSNVKPRMIQFQIMRQGIQVGDILYPYSTLSSFWVIDENNNNEDKIFIKSRKLLMPLVILPFDSDTTNPDDIRNYLLDYLDEEELDEPFAQKLMEYFGF